MIELRWGRGKKLFHFALYVIVRTTLVAVVVHFSYTVLLSLCRYWPYLRLCAIAVRCVCVHVFAATATWFTFDAHRLIEPLWRVSAISAGKKLERESRAPTYLLLFIVVIITIITTSSRLSLSLYLSVSRSFALAHLARVTAEHKKKGQQTVIVCGIWSKETAQKKWWIFEFLNKTSK